jgi:hypothetical protein
MSDQQPQTGHAAACPANPSIHWVVVQQEEGMKFATNGSKHVLSSRPGWRRLLGPWGSWHMLKAQAVSDLLLLQA